MVRVILLDFDGVIAESVEIKTKAFQKLFEDEGADVMEQVRDYHLQHGGVSRFEKFRYFYDEILKRPLSEKTFQDLCDRFSRLVIDEVVDSPYVSGAREFIEEYAIRCALFVTSATPQQEIEEIMRRRDLDRFFKRIYGAPKSKSDAVREIIKSEKISPGETVYIGDALSDYEAARDNNIVFIARIGNSEAEALFRDLPCAKVTDLTCVRDIINAL
ncbi:MAG: HAD family hydrolase [Nitrospirae bacterium]|nr:MAG: HAD family hydrolase [Nitrospirota bacterium]